MKSKNVKKIVLSALLSACAIGTAFPPATAFAAEDAQAATGVRFSLLCDDDVSVKPDDAFRLTVLNTHTEETTEFSIAAEDAIDETKMEFAPGLYAVRDIVYEGTDEELKTETLAIPTYFDSNADFDYVYFAVGENEAQTIQQEHSDVVLKTQERTEELEEQLSEQPTSDQDLVKTGNGVVPKSEIEEPAENTDSESAEAAESSVKEKPEKNPLIGMLPIIVVGIIGAVVLFTLRKKKIV